MVFDSGHFIFCRMRGRKLYRHGTWMIVMKTNDYPITEIQRNLSRQRNLPVCTSVQHYQILNFKLFECTYEPLFDFAELGVLSWRLDADNYETDEKLKEIRESRGYSYTVSKNVYVFLNLSFSHNLFQTYLYVISYVAESIAFSRILCQ